MKKDEIKPKLSGLDPQCINLDDYKEVWNKRAQDYLKKQLNYHTNNNLAKNIIIFIGDGLGTVTNAATRMYLGDEQVQLSYEEFPHFGLAKTYCVNRQVADSACTGKKVIFIIN
jgi:alkaline phosphatase